MIDNSIIQADLIAWLKARATLTALLATNKEVREDQYQGTRFDYPAVRLSLTQQIAILNAEQCDLARLNFSIRSYAEGGSSRVADQIAGEVNRLLHRYNFHGSGWYSWFRSAGLAGATRTGEKLWRAEAFFTGVIYLM